MQANNGRQRQPLAALLTLWRLPDRFHWMAPLPNAHRRGVLLAALLMLVAFLWPTEDKSPDAPTPSSQAQTQVPVTPQAPTPPSTGESSPQENVAPPPLVESGAQTSPPLTQPQEATAGSAAPNVDTTQAPTQPEQPTTAGTTPGAEVWKEFTIQRGHTLAQVFRDNHLVVNDAYLLAQVEGPGKPVNALRIGQKVRIRVAEGNQVTGLEVELTPTQSALFTRQSNGRFLRVH